MLRSSLFLMLSLFAFLSGAPQRPPAALLGSRIWSVASAAGQPTVVNSITITNKSGAAISNYPFQFGRPFVDGAIANAPQVLINGQPVTTQADVKNRYPDGSVEFAVIAVVIPTLPATGSSTLTFQNQATGNNTPLTQAQMLSLSYNFVATTNLVGTTGVAKTASAKLMLQNGDYQLWTSGQVAQTIMLADDTIARKYDIGLGDGYHPIRPRFYATFWPATHQVFVRVVVENGLTTEVEDTAYTATVQVGAINPGGSGSPAPSYSADLSGTQTTNVKVHWAGSRWTRKFWLGGTPSPQVNIDNNLAYLESTRFLPNFDTSITVSPSAVTTEYERYAQNANDIYDGLWDQPTDSTTLENGMGTAGARADIAPYPLWTTLWLYTGDWRMRQVSLGLADQAASWPLHFRESDPTKRFLITDPTGVTPASGYGKPFSRTDRQSAFDARLFDWGIPADNLKAVGPNVDKNIPWSWDGAHQPSYFFPQYILTGDPFYLEEMTFWASMNGFGCWGNSANIQQGCGPYPPVSGQYGGAIHNELRGNGWVVRNRAETAFAEPDGTPERIYFTALTDEAFQRWEGGVNLNGTPDDGKPMKVWGYKVGNDQSANSPSAVNQVPPVLHNWESNCGALNPGPLACVSDITFARNVVGTYTAPWEQWYDQYAIGRVTELGFAAKPMQLYLGKYAIDMINVSGVPDMVALYESPVEMAATSFQGYIAGNTLTVTAINPTNPTPLLTVGENISENINVNGPRCTPAYNPACPIPANTQITALGTGRGAAGTYTLNNSFTYGSAASPGPLISGGFFPTWPALEAAFAPNFLTGPDSPSFPNGQALPSYFASNLGSDGREVWLTPGLAMLVDQSAPGIAPAWAWWIGNVYSKVPDFANDPKWAIVPRTDTNVLPAQP